MGGLKWETLNPWELSYVPCSVCFVRDSKAEGAEETVSTSRLGGRGTPRVAHGAAVNCKRERREGLTQNDCLLHTRFYTGHSVYIIPCREYNKSMRD